MTEHLVFTGKKAVVTGGAGMIGSTIVDELVAAGVSQVVVIDNLTRGTHDNLNWAKANGNVQLVNGDIRDRTLIQDVLSKDVDLVFHQAALRITQCAEDPRLALEVLVDGTFNVLEAAVRADVEKVVAASSASVYGLAESFPTTEDHHPWGNRTLYGAAKVFNEGLLRSFNEMYGLDYVALRYFNVYGPRMDVHGAYTEVLVRWMECLEAGTPPLILGSGEQTMDFIFVTDVARANLLAANSPVTDEVINIATGRETSLRELATLVAQAMGVDLAPVYGPERSVNPVPRRLADVSRAKSLLGFEAQVGLREGLERLVDWWRSVRSRTPDKP